jgi:hypothetical protein
VRLRIRIPAGTSLVRAPAGARLRRGVLTAPMRDIGPRRARALRIVVRVDRTTTGLRRVHARVTARCGAADARAVRLQVRGVAAAVQPAVTG